MDSKSIVNGIVSSIIGGGILLGLQTQIQFVDSSLIAFAIGAGSVALLSTAYLLVTHTSAKYENETIDHAMRTLRAEVTTNTPSHAKMDSSIDTIKRRYYNGEIGNTDLQTLRHQLATLSVSAKRLAARERINQLISIIG